MQYSKIKKRDAYFNFLEKSYSDRQIWETQKKELLDIVNYAKEQNIEFIIVCFPFMVERCRIFTSKVVNLMNYNKIKVFDLAAYFIGRNSKELVVNQFDRHPNETVHKEIAELLFKYIKSRQ